MKPVDSGTVILLNNDGMGKAEAPLPHILISYYLRLLLENDYLPAVICFYTEGVKLVAEGSPVIESLQQLEAKGTRLIVCGTCLDYFGLRNRVAAGIVGGMNDILEAQWRAQKVITL